MQRKRTWNIRLIERTGWIRILRVSLGFNAVLLFAGTCFAQVDRAGLRGTVSDSSGRVVADTHVTAVEGATQLRRETVSDSSGNYGIPALPVGNYTVTFTHEGFKNIEFVDVEQVIGRTRTLNVTLQVAGGEDRVEVSAASALMDRNTSTVTDLIERTQANELPLNGRDWSALTAYVPGAIDTGGSNQRTVRFAGRGLDDSNFSYDGVDATNIVNQTQRQWVRLAIPLDAISEFRVNSLMSTAEDGATGGAQLDVTSPSGTNEFHGHLFEYVRNDAFDAPLPAWANGFFDGGAALEPLRLNQFGGSAGGPIVRNKTFFYLASEAYRQNWGYPISASVPTPAYINSLPSSTSPEVLAILKGFPQAGPRTFVNGVDPSDSNVQIVTCYCTQVVNENSVMLRLEQHFSSKTTSFMRFNYDRSVNTQPLSATATDLQQKVSTPVNGVLEVLHVFNSSLVNEAHAGFNRSTNNQYNNSDTGIVYKISVSGYSPSFATENYDYVSLYVGNSFSGNDNLTWVHNRHTLKAGFEYRHIQLNQEYGQSGTITFSSIENLASDKVKKVSLKSAMPVNGLRKNDYFVFAQDEYRWRQNLVLSLGLRYTIFGLFNEKHGLANPFDFDTCGGYCGVGASFGNQNYADIDPRLAFAWTPHWSEGTVVRGGFGIYHEDGQLDDQNLPAKNELPSYAASSASNCTNQQFTVENVLNNSCYGTGAGTISPNAEQRNRKDTYVEQWSLSLQRELPANFVGTLSYLGSHGVHLLETNVVNLFEAPTYTTLQYPAYSQTIGWRGSIGMSTYNGLSVAARRTFSHGLLVTANYMWSHEIDNGSNGSGDGDETNPQNPLCPACDRASGVWDARSVVNGNAVYRLPFGLGEPMLSRPGIASAIAGNWEMTLSAMARTGFPINVLLSSPAFTQAADGASATVRPDLVPGASLTPPGGKRVAQWINPEAFAYPASATGFGSAPRDLGRGPGTWQIDMSANKTFQLGERGRLQFRSEFYNIFNHPQLGQPSGTCTLAASTSAGCLSGFGLINTTVNTVSPQTPVGSGTPREIQLALRFDF